MIVSKKKYEHDKFCLESEVKYQKKWAEFYKEQLKLLRDVVYSDECIHKFDQWEERKIGQKRWCQVRHCEHCNYTEKIDIN